MDVDALLLDLAHLRDDVRRQVLEVRGEAQELAAVVDVLNSVAVLLLLHHFLGIDGAHVLDSPKDQWRDEVALQVAVGEAILSLKV